MIDREKTKELMLNKNDQKIFSRNVPPRWLRAFNAVWEKLQFIQPLPVPSPCKVLLYGKVPSVKIINRTKL